MSDQYGVRLGSGVYKVSTVQNPIADSAFKVYTQKKESDALYYLTFVDSNNDSPSKELLYTNYGVRYNPATSTLSIGSTLEINSRQISTGSSIFTFGSNSSGITSFIGKIQLGGNEILSSSGTTVVGLAGSDAFFAGDVFIKNDLVVQGNLVTNVPELSVESRIIDLGLLNGGVGIISNTTWDLGLIFHYNEGNVRKKTALIWEYSTKRFQFSSDFTSSNEASVYDTPQLGSSEFAAVEIESLWINNNCTSGAKVVIGCIGGELRLQNIVIDEGEY
jgi:hypothetical protein